MSTTITPKSRTLLRLEKTPETVCASCPNAIWQSLQIKAKPGVRVYCTLMHVLVDDLLTDCDGKPDEETTAQPQVIEAPSAQQIHDQDEAALAKLDELDNGTGSLLGLKPKTGKTTSFFPDN